MDFRYLKKTKKKRSLSFNQLFSVFFKSTIVFGLVLMAIGYTVNPYTWYELKTIHHMNLNTEQVIGEVVDAWVVFEEDEENDAVYGYEYIFSNKQIGQYSGTSFGEKYLKVGEKRLIDFDPGNPFYNRMQGMRVNPNDSWNIYFVLLTFPTGLIIMISGIWNFFNRKMYLERGVLLSGIQTSRHETSGENGTTTHYTYVFEDQKGDIYTINKSGKKIGYLENEELMVYLPECPEKAKIVRTCGSKYFKLNSLDLETNANAQEFHYLKNHDKKRKIEWKVLLTVYFKSFVIFGFAMLIYAVIASPITLRSLLTSALVNNNSESAIAYIQEVWLAKKSDETGPAIYGNEYRFWIGESGPYTGTSYGRLEYEKFDEVKVYFASAAPQFNKLEGMTASHDRFSIFALYSFAFFLGLGIILVETRKFRYKRRFLERGTLVMAERVYFKVANGEEGTLRHQADYQFNDINGELQQVRFEHANDDFLPIKTQLIYLPEIPEKAQSVAWLGARYLIK